MSPRTITIKLPEEPPLGSVVLVEMTNYAWLGPGGPTERLAFQRLADRERQPWRMVGRDPLHGSLSWAEIVGAADGRSIIVLWEPS